MICYISWVNLWSVIFLGVICDLLYFLGLFLISYISQTLKAYQVTDNSVFASKYQMNFQKLYSCSWCTYLCRTCFTITLSILKISLIFVPYIHHVQKFIYNILIYKEDVSYFSDHIEEELAPLIEATEVKHVDTYDEQVTKALRAAGDLSWIQFLGKTFTFNNTEKSCTCV